MPDLKNCHRLFVCFLLGFWLFGAGCTTEPVETDLLLPVDFTNTPGGMVLTYRHTDKITVRVKGVPKRLEQIETETLLYPADLYTDLAFDPVGGIRCH